MVKLYLIIVLFFVFRNLVFSSNVSGELVIGDTIIDPIETRIKCNCEFRENTLLNIIVYNSEITNELKGIIAGVFTFDTIIYDTLKPLIIKNFDASWLRLIDVVTKEIIFNQSIEQSMDRMEDYEIFVFYKDKLLPIVMNMKCWAEYYNYFYPPTNSRIFFHFPFRIIPE
jgi:hypothetical protein